MCFLTRKKVLFKILTKISNLKLFIAHNNVNIQQIQIFLLYMLLVIFNFRYVFINQVQYFFLTIVIFISFCQGLMVRSKHRFEIVRF